MSTSRITDGFRKGFTLIEIVITIVVVAFVLAMVTGMGRGFSERVRFANTKEQVVSAISNVLQEAATTNVVSTQSGAKDFDPYRCLLFQEILFVELIAHENLPKEIIEESRIDNGMIWATGFSASLSPYGIGCEIIDDAMFSIVSSENLHLQACYQLVGASCKLQEISCN